MYGALRNEKGSIQEYRPQRELSDTCRKDSDDLEENGAKECCNIDQILQTTRPYGPFQRLLTIAMCVLNMPGSMAIYLTYFIATEVPWKCAANSTTCTSNITHLESDTGRCAYNRTEWEFLETPKNSLQVYFNLYCTQEWEVYLLTSSLFLGWGFGSLLISHLADRYGRRKIIFATLLAVLLFGMASVYSPRVEIFVALRFLLGLGIPGQFHIVYTAMGEFTENTYRPLALNIIQTAGTLSVCIFCLIAYYIRDWKMLTMVTTLPFLLSFIFLFFVPESLRWLYANGKMEEFQAVVRRICRWNNVPIPSKIHTLRAAGHNKQTKSKTLNVLKLFSTYKVGARSVKLLYSWFVIGLLYYSISLAASTLTGSFYRDFILIKSVEIPSNLIAVYLCDRLGRKKTIATNVIIASAACLLIAGVPIGHGTLAGIFFSEGKVKLVRLVLGILGNFTLNMSFGLFTSWTMELYGTDLRALGMGASNLLVRVGGATSPWIVNALGTLNKRIPFLAMGSLGLSCGCVMFMIPETKDVAMCDVSGSNEVTDDVIDDNVSGDSGVVVVGEGDAVNDFFEPQA